MAEKPPNLRFSDSDRDCSNCVAFKERSQTCSMFSDFPVSPELVCDAWKADPEKAQGSGAVRANVSES